MESRCATAKKKTEKTRETRDGDDETTKTRTDCENPRVPSSALENQHQRGRYEPDQFFAFVPTNWVCASLFVGEKVKN